MLPIDLGDLNFFVFTSKLSLINNQIRELRHGIFNDLPNLRSLSLYNNESRSKGNYTF